MSTSTSLISLAASTKFSKYLQGIIPRSVVSSCKIKSTKEWLEDGSRVFWDIWWKVLGWILRKKFLGEMVGRKEMNCKSCYISSWKLCCLDETSSKCVDTLNSPQPLGTPLPGHPLILPHCPNSTPGQLLVAWSHLMQLGQETVHLGFNCS